MKKKRFVVLCIIGWLLFSFPHLVSTQTSNEDDLFQSPPSQDEQVDLVKQETGLDGQGLQGATKNSDGSISLQSASSLTSEDGTVYNNVKKATIDSNGHIVEAESLEYGEGTFKNVKYFQGKSNGNFEIAEAEQVALAGNLITDGKNIIFENGLLLAESADSFVKAGTIAGNILNLEAGPLSFSVEQADTIMSGCIAVNNIQNSQFTIFGNALELTADPGQPVTLTDCGQQEITFDPTTENSKITVSKENPSRYLIEQGKLTCTSKSEEESVEINHSASLKMGGNCFSCMNIDSGGTYWHRSQEVISDFGIKVSEKEDKYRLCLRKLEGEPMDNYDGIVDFISNEVHLNGITGYFRLPFIQHSSNLSDYSLLSPYKPVIIYEGRDEANQAIFSFDKNFLFVDRLFVSNSHPQISPFAITHTGYFTIEETFDNDFKRYGDVRSTPFSKIVKNYSSKYISQKIRVNSTLVQDNKEKKSRVTIHEPGQETMEELLRILREIRKRHRLS